MFEKDLNIGYLLDFYGELLSERKRSVMDKFLNACSLITAFSKIYFKRMRRYNFTFYMTRVLGACRSVLN